MAKGIARSKVAARAREGSLPEDHGHQRTIYRVGNSWVVPVPAWTRRLLERGDGGSVYWHDFRPGEVVLGVEPIRSGGRPSGGAAERKIARLTKENLRLRRRLRARPLGVLSEQIGQVMMQAIRVGLPVEATVKETHALVKELYARAPLARRTRAPRAKRPAAPEVEPVEAPVLAEPADPRQVEIEMAGAHSNGGQP